MTAAQEKTSPPRDRREELDAYNSGYHIIYGENGSQSKRYVPIAEMSDQAAEELQRAIDAEALNQKRQPHFKRLRRELDKESRFLERQANKYGSSLNLRVAIDAARNQIFPEIAIYCRPGGPEDFENVLNFRGTENPYFIAWAESEILKANRGQLVIPENY